MTPGMANIDSRISVGSAVAVDGQDLVARVSGRVLRVTLDSGRFVFSGGKCGAHSLDADSSITSAKRLLAHWRGYVENNASYMTDGDIAALAQEAVDAACKLIQDRLGVTTGDLAAAVLSGGVIERELERYIRAELQADGSEMVDDAEVAS